MRRNFACLRAFMVSDCRKLEVYVEPSDAVPSFALILSDLREVVRYFIAASYRLGQYKSDSDDILLEKSCSR